MAIENVQKFEERVRGDEALQARLRELSDAFEGDREDSRAVFEAVITPVATEAGLPYTYDEALECAAHKGDDEDLTADEARAVAGGVSDFCFVLGFGDVNADSCYEQDESSGTLACAGIGAGYLLI